MRLERRRNGNPNSGNGQEFNRAKEAGVPRAVENWEEIKQLYYLFALARSGPSVAQALRKMLDENPKSAKQEIERLVGMFDRFDKRELSAYWETVNKYLELLAELLEPEPAGRPQLRSELENKFRPFGSKALDLVDKATTAALFFDQPSNAELRKAILESRSAEELIARGSQLQENFNRERELRAKAQLADLGGPLPPDAGGYYDTHGNYRTYRQAPPGMH